MKKTIPACLFLLMVIKAYSQQEYYVDGLNGNDNYSGTTLSSAWKTIQKAGNTATPNSTVYIKGGTYHETISINISGTPGNPITIKNYLNEVVLIDGAGTGGSTLLSMTNKNYLNFQNLVFQNLTTNDAQGILVETTGANTSTNLTFKNITIKNINWTNNAATIPGENDNAQGFIAYGRNGGITNLTIDSCDVFNNILGYSEAISLDGNIDGFIIKDCTVHNNTNIGIAVLGNYQTSTNPVTDHARNGVVVNNVCHNNISLYATSGGIYVDGGKNVTVERNECYLNGNGIEIGCEEDGTTENIIVKNNVLYNNEESGIYIGGYTTETTGQVLNCILRNNTLFQNNYSNDETGEIAISKASGCIFENNIFYTSNQNVFISADNIDPQTGNTFNYNCWYTPSGDPEDLTVNWRESTYDTFMSYTTGTFQDAGSLFANPNLENDILPVPGLNLLSVSPCIDHGKPATSITNGEMDFAGNNRVFGSVIDIGAYEYGAPTSAINLERNRDRFVIYPNPLHSETTIYSPYDLKNAVITLYDISGRQIRGVKDLTGRQITLAREHLPDGVYLYTIVQGNKLLAKGRIIAE